MHPTSSSPVRAVAVAAAVALSTALALPLGGAAQAPAAVPEGTLIVLNKSAATATFVALPSGRVLATLPTGGGPHELALSRDGATGVVTDYGGGAAGGRTLTVLDVRGRRVARTIELGAHRRPHGIGFLPGDSLVAVTSEESGTVVLVHPASGTVRRAIATRAEGSHMLTFAGPGAGVGDGTVSRIYTGDMGSHTVSELDLTTGERTRAFAVPERPEAVGMPASGGEVWAGSNARGTVSAIDLETGTVRTVAEGFEWPYRIVFTPNDATVLIPDPRLHELRIMARDAGAGERGVRELARLPFPGGAPQGIAVSPDGRHAFLSLSAQGQVAVIDLALRRVLATVEVGPSPDGIGFVPAPSAPEE